MFQQYYFTCRAFQLQQGIWEYNLGLKPGNHPLPVNMNIIFLMEFYLK